MVKKCEGWLDHSPVEVHDEYRTKYEMCALCQREVRMMNVRWIWGVAISTSVMAACSSETVNDNSTCGSNCAVQNTAASAVTGSGGASSIVSGGSAGTGGALSFTGGVSAGTGGLPATTGGAVVTPVTGGVATTGGVVPLTGGVAATGGVMATGGGVVTGTNGMGCKQTLPAVTDYSAPGPFATMTADGSGPDGMYTMVRPSSVGDNGFLHPILTWGNGITTTPAIYPTLLSTVASHGFIVIASDSTSVSVDLMKAGLDWLIQQNDPGGMFEGKLDVNCAISMGYSLGGQGSVGTGSHPNVIATIAMHPAGGSPAGLHGPLLLFSGTDDTVCTPAQFVQPVYDQSPVPTFFAMLDGATHTEPVLTGGRELAPSIAWLRMWAYGDQGGHDYFYGDNCILCQAPFITPQSKNLP